jgi:hypothetical protein
MAPLEVGCSAAERVKTVCPILKEVGSGSQQEVQEVERSE